MLLQVRRERVVVSDPLAVDRDNDITSDYVLLLLNGDILCAALKSGHASGPTWDDALNQQAVGNIGANCLRELICHANQANAQVGVFVVLAILDE